MHLMFFLPLVAALFIPVVPVRFDGLLVRRDPILAFVVKPHWKRVDDLGAKLQVQEYTLLLHWPFKFMLQLHVARYDKGGFLRPHTDAVYGKLLRIQCILRNAARGGELLCDHFIINRRNFKIFEPGKYRHEVTKVEEGRRLLLNFGVWLAPRRPPPYAAKRG